MASKMNMVSQNSGIFSPLAYSMPPFTNSGDVARRIGARERGGGGVELTWTWRGRFQWRGRWNSNSYARGFAVSYSSKQCDAGRGKKKSYFMHYVDVQFCFRLVN